MSKVANHVPTTHITISGGKKTLGDICGYLDIYEHLNAIVLIICGCGFVSRSLCKPDESCDHSPQKNVHRHFECPGRPFQGVSILGEDP